MTVKEQTKIKTEDIVTIKLDFDKLKKWQDLDKDGLPITGCLSFYTASGLIPYITKYSKQYNGIVPADMIFCNFYTFEKIKKFIQENWERYSINIDRDNHVFWNDDKWGRKPHYRKKVKAIIRNSIQTDFMNYCPGLDDDLDDDTLVFRIYTKIMPAEDKK